MSQNEKAEPARILRYPEVFHRTGYHRTSLFKMERVGKFPKRISLGPKSVGWLESEVDAWIAARVGARDASPVTKTESPSPDATPNQPQPRKRGRPPGPHHAAP